MATVRDLAWRLGCSAATVSRALRQDPRLRPETIARVMSCAAEFGFPKRRQGRAATRLVLVLVRERGVTPSLQSAEAIAGLRAAARRDGVAIAQIQEDLPDSTVWKPSPGLRRILDDTRLAGIAVLGGLPTPIAEILIRRAPLVTMGHDLALPGIDAVQADHHRSADTLVGHLRDLGHRRIGLVANSADDAPNRDRVAGYHAALERWSLPHEDDQVVRFRGEDLDAVARYRLVEAARQGVTAWLVARNDGGAWAIDVFREAGLRVPEDVSVVAFHRIGRLADGRRPTICPIAFERLGQELYGSLSDRWQGRSGGRRLLISCPLMVGETSGPVAAPLS